MAGFRSKVNVGSIVEPGTNMRQGIGDIANALGAFGQNRQKAYEAEVAELGRVEGERKKTALIDTLASTKGTLALVEANRELNRVILTYNK